MAGGRSSLWSLSTMFSPPITSLDCNNFRQAVSADFMTILLDSDFPKETAWSHDEDLRDTQRECKTPQIIFSTCQVQRFKLSYIKDILA